MEAAAAKGQLHICHALRQKGYAWGTSLAAAAWAGKQNVCEWLLANGCEWESEALYAAARGGHVGLMLWLMLRRPPGPQYHITEVCLLAAVAEGCELAFLQALHAAWLGHEERSTKEEPQQDSTQARQAGCTAGDQAPAPTSPRPQQHSGLLRLDRPVQRQLTDWEKGRILAAAARSSTTDWQAKVEWLEAQGYTRSLPVTCVSAAVPDAVERRQWLWARGYSVQ